MSEIKLTLYEIADEVYNNFDLFTPVNKVRYFPEKLKNLNDVVVYNSYKMFNECLNEEVVDKFMNVAMDINCELRARKYPFRVATFMIYRTLQQQIDFWLQGRYKEGRVITYALPGQSLHHYGCAMDLVFWNKRSGWSWNSKHPWFVIKDIAKRYRCITYKWDSPHVEIRFPEVEELRKEVTRYFVEKMKENNIDWTFKMKSIPSWLSDLK